MNKKHVSLLLSLLVLFSLVLSACGGAATPGPSSPSRGAD
jgi:predicted small secreted protein